MWWCAAHAGYYQHNIGRTEAAEALRPFAGEATYLLFTIGIVGVGLLAIPVLAGRLATPLLLSRSKWKSGLHQPLRQAYAFYGGTIIYASLVGP